MSLQGIPGLQAGEDGRQAAGRPAVPGMPPGYLELSHAGPHERAARPADRDLAAYAVAARGLTKVFPGKGRKGRARGPKTAVSELDLTVEAGSISGLLGPNGSGKTTTIEMITGLLPPTSGTVMIFGRAPGPRATNRLIGVISQQSDSYKKITARQNLMFHARLYGLTRAEARKRVEAALELADLRERADEEVALYSGGMARRLQIAEHLLHGPKVIFMDEPTLGVDPGQRTALWGSIRELARAGVAVLLTTNMLEEAARLCGRVAILDHGRLVDEDAPGQLQRKYGHVDITVEVALSRTEGTAGLVDATRQACRAALDDVLLIPGVRSAKGRGTGPAEAQLLIRTDTDKGTTGRVFEALSRNGELDITDIETGLPTLDEVFEKLTGPHRTLR